MDLIDLGAERDVWVCGGVRVPQPSGPEEHLVSPGGMNDENCLAFPELASGMCTLGWLPVRQGENSPPPPCHLVLGPSTKKKTFTKISLVNDTISTIIMVDTCLLRAYYASSPAKLL